jgi:leader peptidase (prepilin peptidase) / N-methyltransferase
MTIVLLFTAVLAGLLSAISVIDIRTLRIPNGLNAMLLISGALFWFAQRPETLPYQIANGVVVATLLWLVRFGHARFSGRIGLGLGDVKMMGAGAVWISPLSVPLLVFIASFFGLVYAFVKGNRGGDMRIPFGPFLALGLMSTWLMENLR